LKTANTVLVILHFEWLVIYIHAVVYTSYGTSRVQPWTWKLCRGISGGRFEIYCRNSCHCRH